MDENQPCLLIGIPSRDPFLVTQYLERYSVSSDQHMKKLMSLREGLHAMMQCYMRQHYADCCWLQQPPGGHASWRERTMRKFTKESITYFVKGPVCRWNVQKMRSESSEYVRKTTGFSTNSWRMKIALESCIEEHAQEVWERNWMNTEMRATLLNTYPPKLIATILKALREQLKENDQLNAVEEIAGVTPAIPLEYGQILKGGGGFWDDAIGGHLPENLVLTARREEIEWVHSEDVHEIVPMQECKDAGKKLLKLNWVDTEKSVDPALKDIRSRLRAREHKTKKQSKIQRALLVSQLFSAMPPLESVKAVVSIMMSVSWPNKGKPIELATLRHQPSTFPRNSPETHPYPTFQQKIVRNMGMELETRLTSGNSTT